MASISSGSAASFTPQQGAAIRQYQQRRRRQNEMDARMVQQNQQNQDYQEQQRMMYQRQLQEEEYNRSIASPGGLAASRMNRQQLVQRRLERRRQERRLRTNEMQNQAIHQPPPPPPPGTSPRSIMKKNSSYQTMPDQQYFHNHQRQPQHTSSNYSSDSSSANYISPPILNRKQPFPDGPNRPSQSDNQVFTQNGVVIDRAAFRPTRNRLRLPHESPSDEWSRNGNPANQSRVQQGQYQQQYQQHPQSYFPDTPSQNSAVYDKQSQLRGNSNNRQPNWQELDRQRLMYQKQMTTRHQGHMGQQQNLSYVSDDEDAGNDRRVNASFNSQTNTPQMKQNRSRSLSRERQIPRRWRHNRPAASMGRGDTSQSSSVNTPLPTEDSSQFSQFQYTPRSRLAVSESLGQSEVNTSMSSHPLSVRSNPLQNGRDGWMQHKPQHHQQQHNQHQLTPSEHGWERQDRQSQAGWTHHDQHARHQNLVSPSRSEASNYSDRDQETASVASIRKAWEGRVEQQRGRSRDNSYDRRHNTGENPFGMWEERDNRVSQSRQVEQRREQKRNIENKWRRNSSLPPPERRCGRLRQEEYSDVDGYQSDGGYRNQPHRVDVDAAHVSIHDARRRLWDQDERLRAVLPQTDSFDSIDDGRNHRPFPSIGLASPGNVSALSTGSALFKSKFVHAAALATQKRDLPVDRGYQNSFHYPNKVKEESPKGSSRMRDLPVDRVHQNSFHYPNKVEEESPKGSSQITDSTADTTAPSSNHTSHGENARGSQFTKQPTATMPSIAEARPVAEAPQVSVADLIARINAVSRDNPAEALARIDSIIKGESAGDVKHRQPNSGVSSLFNFDAAKKQTVSSGIPRKENVTNDPPAAPHEGKRFAFDDDGDEHEDHDDPSIDDSLLSSGESTVSSMTNPTYQSVRETRRKKSPTNHMESERKAPSPQVVTTRLKGVEYQMSVDKQEPRSNRGGDEGPLTKEKLSVDKQEPRSNRDGDDGPLTKEKLQSFNNDTNWTSAPQSDFFNEFGGFRNASSQAVASSKAMQSKKRVPERPTTPDLMNAVSSAFSDVNISFGDTRATQDLLAKAFSDVGEKGRAQTQNVMANAFSDVDISMEQKTVRQRRKELELLSKSVTGASEDAGNMNQNKSSGFDWDREEEPKKSPTKQKKRIEPTLRLKSNKKLTQKFANLVKAFEHF